MKTLIPLDPQAIPKDLQFPPFAEDGLKLPDGVGLQNDDAWTLVLKPQFCNKPSVAGRVSPPLVSMLFEDKKPPVAQTATLETASRKSFTPQ